MAGLPSQSQSMLKRVRHLLSTGVSSLAVRQLREVRGTKSIYHNNAIQSWEVGQNGEVGNVHVA